MTDKTPKDKVLERFGFAVRKKVKNEDGTEGWAVLVRQGLRWNEHESYDEAEEATRPATAHLPAPSVEESGSDETQNEEEK
jgi:hypothetical protein